MLTWAWSDILDIIPSAVATNVIGIKIFVIKLLMKVINNKSIGSSIPDETMFPVVIISVINRGIKELAKLVKFCTAVFISIIMLEKLVIIKVTISIYSM